MVMKRFRQIAAWAAVCAVMALAARTPETDAARRRNEALRSRYEGWAGTLRLWTLDEAFCGTDSLAAWLANRAAAFAKAHAGVYVQISSVDGETLRGFAAQAGSPPDMLLFPPGLLENPQGLLALPDVAPLRAGLAACGLIGEARFALPVAIGAYGMAYDRAALDGLPADWSALPDRPRDGMLWLGWPKDSAYCRWSRAMGDLLAPAPPTPEGDETRPPPAGEGLDLGLPASAMATLPRLLPDSFQAKDSVFAPFARGEIAAMPVTPREIARLRALSDTGRAPDWAVAARASAFTDQVALLAVTDCARPGEAARQALCVAFARLLLADESQSKLTRSGAFPAIDLPSLYAGVEGMAQLEAGLAGQTLETPPAFGS